MSCPHATTTTVAWCFGEAPEGHLEHVATCAECQQVVEEQEAVLAAVGDVAPALRMAAEAAPVEPTPNAGRSWPRVAAAVLAFAAAALVAVVVGGSFAPAPEPQQVAVAPVDTAPPAVALPPLRDVDARLDALQLELDALSADPSIL